LQLQALALRIGGLTKGINMNAIELAVAGLSSNLDMAKSHVADFSDQDMLLRPVPNANHTAWQLGHLCVAEGWMVNCVAPGVVPATSAGFAEKFTKETSKIDDIKAFPTKAQIFAEFDKTRAAVIAWAKTLAPADLDKPGPEAMKDFIPTVGALLTLLPGHVMMHVGQIQVIRRKLGRAVMF
jgi:DinB family protein